MNGSLVFVMLNDCLITVKSGNPHPLNIGDFMPDYNLWYAFKFMQPSIIIILDTPDIATSYPSTSYFTAKINFVSKWLSQVCGIREVYSSYSVNGTWNSSLYPGSKDILMSAGVRRYLNIENKIFIDNDFRSSEEYIRLNHPGIEYLSKSEFIKIYNKNPRVYEKKFEDQGKKAISRILGGPDSEWGSK